MDAHGARAGREPLLGLRADLHIHSVLSPCAERDMTPGNIIGMAMLLGLDVIAITDHQSCGNCAAAMAISAALEGPLVIPGMEIESAEEIHLLCLFPDLGSARACEADIRASQPKRANRPDIFGEQWLMDENDERVGEEPRLLMSPSCYSCDEIAVRVLAAGGVCIPAHLDREANSMLVSLGAVPPDFPTDIIELSTHAVPDAFFRTHPGLAGYRYLVNSDAHSLETFAASRPDWAREGPAEPAAKPKMGREGPGARPETSSKPDIKQVIEALRPRRT